MLQIKRIDDSMIEGDIVLNDVKDRCLVLMIVY